ncbi:MAG: outer membrane beta-barrel protein [Proteobacteria bacterium]|nr:outer membrane beta-barrel protein [Pseudomonadota bacterium]
MKPIPIRNFLRYLGAAGGLSMACLSAQAADMRGTLLPPLSQGAPSSMSMAVEDSGLYLRGDLGYSFNRASDIYYSPANTAGESTLSRSLKNSGLVAVGIGYQINPMLRGDITLEQRGRSEFRYLDRVENPGSPANYYLNDVRGKLGLRVAMVNAYANLGTWQRFTPFLGLGVGVAATSVRDVFNKGVGPGNNHPDAKGIGTNIDSTSLAYAVHAGVSYAVARNWSVELGYRYLGLNTVRGGTMNCYNAGTATYVACGYRTMVKNFGAHDLKFGLRYLFADPAPAPMYPQPGYMMQAPLSVKG